MHVHCFSFNLFAVVVGNGYCYAVVCGYGCLLLGVAQFLEGCSDGDGFLGIQVKGSYFSFSGRSKDILLDLDEGVDGSIVGYILVVALVTKPEASACPAPCFWSCEVGGSTVNVQLHGTGMVSDGRSRMGCQVVQHVVVFFASVGGGFGLLRAEIIGHVVDGWVNCSTIT